MISSDSELNSVTVKELTADYVVGGPLRGTSPRN